MYKNEFENIEIYFLCEKTEQEIVEVYYDEQKDTHYWYFNTYPCYLKWKTKFKGLKLQKLTKNLLIIAASRYIISTIENEDYHNAQEYQALINDLNKIEPEIKKIITENEILSKL